MEYKDLFEYNDINIDGKVKLSPSGFSLFFENPKVWYKNNILRDNNFSGNTATIVGTILHARIGAYWKGIEIDEDVEVEYISQYDDNPEVDCWKISDEVANLWDIVPDHIVQMKKPTSIEEIVSFEIPNTNYHISGTYDYANLEDLRIGDIKTTSTTPKKIKVSHRIQLLLYCLAIRYSQGIVVDQIEVLYLVKTKKPKIVTLVEKITEDDYEWIKDQVKSMVKRIELVENDNSLMDIIFYNNPDSYIK